MPLAGDNSHGPTTRKYNGLTLLTFRNAHAGKLGSYILLECERYDFDTSWGSTEDRALDTLLGTNKGIARLAEFIEASGAFACLGRDRLFCRAPSNKSEFSFRILRSFGAFWTTTRALIEFRSRNFAWYHQSPTAIVHINTPAIQLVDSARQPTSTISFNYFFISGQIW